MRKDQSLFRQVGLSLVCAGLVAAGCAQKTDEPNPAAADKAPAASPKPLIATTAADPAKVLIQINDKKLTEGDLAKLADEQFQQVASMVPPEQALTYRSQMRVQAAQSFIVTTLLENEAVKRNITVNDADIEKAIADITKRLPPDMTLAKVLETENMTPEVFRERLKKDLPVKKLFDMEIGEIPEAEVAAFYDKQKSAFEEPEQATARHILVKVDEKAEASTNAADKVAAKAAAKAKIDDLRKQLEGGADFATLAKANSDCPSAKEGGLLPTFGRGQMVKEFEDAAFTQPTNTIGAVVETQFGYHIIKVISKTSGRTLPLDEVKGKIVEYLKMMKSRKIIPPFIDKLRAENKVVVDAGLEQEIKAQKLADEARQAAGEADEGEEGAVQAAPAGAAPAVETPVAPDAPATPSAPATK